MAVAGLHNVSAFGSSLFIESQSSASRQRSEHDRPRTRASSILQMWRELEGEHAVSNSYAPTEDRLGPQRNDRVNEDQNQSHIELDNYFDDGRSVSSDLSSDLGEVERERVRQLIQEWMHTGAKGHSQSLNVSNANNCSKVQLLGENERARVRIIKEWVRTNIHRSGTSSPRDEVAPEIGSQFEQVRDGLSVNHSQHGKRKALRRLCGRQALVDLLMRSQREREKELQGLLDCKPVSDFAYRNRIQSLLRGRFLRNDNLSSDERTASNAASELGLLRQRHTVSDLREEILSRLDDNVRGSTSNMLPSSPKDVRQPSQSNSEQEVIDECYDQSELVNEEREINGSHVVTNSASSICEHVNHQYNMDEVAETSEQVGENEDQEQYTSNLESSCSLPERQNNGNSDLAENAGEGWLLEATAIEGSQQGGHLLENHATFNENDAMRSEASDSQEVVEAYFRDLDRNIFEDYDWEGSSAQAEELQEFIAEREQSDLEQAEQPEEFVAEHDESESQNMYDDQNEWVYDATENMVGDSQEGTPNQSYPESLDGGIEEQNHAQDPHDEWHEEAIDDWFDTPSGQDDGSIGRVDTFYIPDDDNVYSIELRELLSRRRVSNLLRSSFRESLNQLIQSYVERQGHASFDWDMDGTSSYPSDAEQEQQQENVNPDGPQINIEGNPFTATPPQETHSQPHWNREPEHQNLPRQHPHQRMGESEWDIINELKIDMAVLHQRMNDMQRMLQTCMEMQVELQRSVRQEVSAALNRSAGSTDVDVCANALLNDEPKWDKVRKGICCLCCKNNIDSLLYRCGHMCTCTKCAEKLVDEKAKCPMCLAPVVEVIRAFSIQ
ncbi:hypothetical protein P3L10_029584 [Capsicum annuum]|uniref:uncharacterized protein LOC107847988 n=1 Tax=Capsicum annuum TaxID=4072 RepID=UPI0007BF092E|nr:uncharacterized protein LOC107847988 [Capsicum annuum]XP_016548109.1 uncharacterized protein LOC107847988 [Capsicum annuum]XP_016548111.1 uncharacterized protein LOC107847988 [Capsicum annuum]XP_016548112.1 uncharacterized protein LOC107847988 [Capsicum annuum]XP_047255865.1 uncharacterized protein LOC107847988 [Capsicum annuum]XP_047255866.1 uncharacterized protein LOC107847988 [Capsicum annuum]